VILRLPLALKRALKAVVYFRHSRNINGPSKKKTKEQRTMLVVRLWDNSQSTKSDKIKQIQIQAKFA
jgi:hypothetical protein